MSTYTDEEIARVAQANPIADVVREHGIELAEASKGALKGLCPFHDEKAPSFNVTPARGYYYCFGCSDGGDVITFVRKTKDIGFNQAVHYLAGRAQMDITMEHTR